MKLARVVGSVWASHHVEGLSRHKLLLVAPLDSEERPTGELVVAADVLGCGVGETVTLTFGSGARNVLGNSELPIEACINGIVDEGDEAGPGCSPAERIAKGRN